jgi:hypothetical protein
MASNNKPTQIPFTSLQDINRTRRGRPITLFGVGAIAEKTARLLGENRIHSIVDNASNILGEEHLGIIVSSPDSLAKKEGEKSFVIICTTSFAEVSEQLEVLGLVSKEDYCVSPILNDLRIIDELENVTKKLLFTSGSPKQDSPLYGGGIYELTIDRDKWHHKKVIEGNCYGLIKFGSNFISVDTERGIFEFDESYNIIRSVELPSGTRAHGVDYSAKHDKFFVVGSYLDGVLVLDNNFEPVDKISVTYKKDRTGNPHHHCNDCLVKDDSLYVSMFSATGNWKRDIFDGAVLEFDIETNELIGPAIQNLWMPHNISFIEGSLHVLNSLQGQLKSNNMQVIGEFPAFTRGLDHDGMFYYIGQSRNRNYSKNIGVSLNTSIDAGIIVFDGITKVSRFLQLPPKLSEIHTIRLLD